MIRSNIGVEIKLTSIIPTLDIVFRQISTFLEDSVVVVWPEGNPRRDMVHRHDDPWCGLGVKVRNMKMDFNTGGTWCRVGQ